MIPPLVDLGYAILTRSSGPEHFMNLSQLDRDTGLIMNTVRVRKISEYLERHPDEGPVLPVSGDRYKIEPGSAASNASVTLLQSSLHDYTAYFDTLGFNIPARRPTIRIEDDVSMRSGWFSYYDPSSEAIVIDRRVISDVDCPRREYTHHTLLAQRPYPHEIANIWEFYLLESDLADYFVASFSDRPQLYRGVAQILDLPSAYVRTLDNETRFTASTPPELAFNEGREVWGGAFWAIRSALGKQAADILLAIAWRRMAVVETGADTSSNFVAAMLSAAVETDGTSEAQSKIIDILRKRDFPTAGPE
jgi:hypothetical protein